MMVLIVMRYTRMTDKLPDFFPTFSGQKTRNMWVTAKTPLQPIFLSFYTLKQLFSKIFSDIKIKQWSYKIKCSTKRLFQTFQWRNLRNYSLKKRK